MENANLCHTCRANWVHNFPMTDKDTLGTRIGKSMSVIASAKITAKLGDYCCCCLVCLVFSRFQIQISYPQQSRHEFEFEFRKNWSLHVPSDWISNWFNRKYNQTQQKRQAPTQHYADQQERKIKPNIWNKATLETENRSVTGRHNKAGGRLFFRQSISGFRSTQKLHCAYHSYPFFLPLTWRNAHNEVEAKERDHLRKKGIVLSARFSWMIFFPASLGGQGDGGTDSEESLRNEYTSLYFLWLMLVGMQNHSPLNVGLVFISVSRAYRAIRLFGVAKVEELTWTFLM